MAADLQQTLRRLQAKMLVVNDRFALVCNQRDTALERVAALEQELHTERARADRLGRRSGVSSYGHYHRSRAQRCGAHPRIACIAGAGNRQVYCRP